MDYIEEIEGKHGLTAKIFHDDCYGFPRDWDNVGFFQTTNNRYFSLQEGPYDMETLQKVLEFRAGCYEFLWDKDNEHEVENYEEELEELEAWSADIPYILPVFIYAHSGVSISTGGFNDPWDSGQVGYYYATKDSMEKMGTTAGFIESALEGEVSTMNQYLSGEVYGFVIEDKDGDAVDSCGGFYGMEYCEEEARGNLLHAEQEIDKLEWKKEVYHI